MREDFFLPEGVYLDSACMSLRPQQVLAAMQTYEETLGSCAGRSTHKLAEEVSTQITTARNLTKKFFSASRKQSVVFTKNASEALNVVANAIPLSKEDVIITSVKEHNSNHLPWLRRAARVGCTHELLPANPDIDVDTLEELLIKYHGRVKVVSLVHVSNVDGSVLDVKRVRKLTKKHNALFVLDACQSAGHIDVDASLADAVAFSSHKMLGPSLGVLIANTSLLEAADPLLIGGGSVVSASATAYELAGVPERFEAGLQDYAAILGFVEAMRYLKKYNVKNVHTHTQELVNNVQAAFSDDSRINVFGQGSICCFEVPNVTSQEIGLLLSEQGVFVRAGQHCAHTYFSYIGKEGVVRASFHLYNNQADADKLIAAIKELLEVVC
ncbi:MAG: aminotransferase class V-fold PLP-dependent enzyme [Candidatus Woesearchaeota archaeon]